MSGALPLRFGLGYKGTMGPVIPFRRRSILPITLGAITAAVLAFGATTAFLHWKGGTAFQHSDVKSLRPDPVLTGPIEVIDGDTVRLNGTAYRLIGFDTPERGDKAQCDDERRRAENATHQLLDLIATGNARLTRVACACPPGQRAVATANTVACADQ